MSNTVFPLTSALGVLLIGAAIASPAVAQMKAVRIASGLAVSVYACAPAGDTDRIFIIEQPGRIRILKHGVVLPTPFLDVGAKVSNGYELGLLGLAFHPNFDSNGYFYISYTRAADNASMLERYRVDPATPNRADPLSAVVVAGPVAQPQTEHNAGCLQFGADGKLYWSIGDGGGANDSGPGHPPVGNGQSGQTLLGKISRFDVDIPFPHIPPDNPFLQEAGIRDEVWALGYRNPWRFSFDRETGDMWVGDVGQVVREEINFEPAGAGGRNYGWKCMEGTVCTQLSNCACAAPQFRSPLEEFDHSFACAVIGGYMYRGCSMPSLRGTYFYGDYCSGRVWTFTYDRNTGAKGPVIEVTSQIAPGGGMAIDEIGSFGEDGNGELLIVDLDGEIYRLTRNGAQDCNGNGIDDICDLASGDSLDANANAQPDECEGSAPVAFCSAKVNSLGCTPQLEVRGYPSATRGQGCWINARDVRNNKVGLMFYGVSGRAAAPFQGGTLCIAAPIKRTPGTVSGGTPPPAQDCSGSYRIDFNAFLVGNLGGNPSPALSVPGTVAVAQWWGRDPGYTSPNNSTLSAGVEFQICP